LLSFLANNKTVVSAQKRQVHGEQLPHLVIGSVLRPVDDHRMYEKVGLALAATDKFDVHIVGFCSQGRVRSKNITFHQVFRAERLSARRFLSPIAFFKTLLKLKPEVVVVNSPDLLIVTISYKILFGKKLIYDVLENYAANIMFANTFPLFVRYPLAAFVRLTEAAAYPWVDEYWLAERVYREELIFTKGKDCLVENRFVSPTDVASAPRRGYHRLVYSGTVAESYGVFDAIDFAKRLHAVDNRFCLVIVGYAAQPAVRKRLYQETASFPFIRLVGISHWVPHTEVLKYIYWADIGLLPYRVNQATRRRVPTKFYEYAALSLPFLASKNAYWDFFEESFKKAELVDFQSFDENDMILLLISLSVSSVSSLVLDNSYYTNIFSIFGRKIY
jgi:hypothetical protein